MFEFPLNFRVYLVVHEVVLHTHYINLYRYNKKA